MTDEEADSLAGTFLEPYHIRTVIKDQTIALKPDGSILAILIKNVIPQSLARTARDNLREAAAITTNRGMAAGTLTNKDVEQFNAEMATANRKTAYVKKGNRMVRILNDGTASKSLLARPVQSGVVGYFDRNSRFPYCRQTAFVIEHEARMRKVMPFIRSVNEVFAHYAPDRYAAQMAVVRETNPDFVINDTAFTTITVNRNFRTACHKDAGDYKPGIGVLTVLQTGQYAGGLFCIPKYGIGLDLRTCDVLLADVHEWHGNTDIKPLTANWERISCVFYYRENMRECGSAVEERVRADETVTKRYQKSDEG